MARRTKGVLILIPAGPPCCVNLFCRLNRVGQVADRDALSGFQFDDNATAKLVSGGYNFRKRNVGTSIRTVMDQLSLAKLPAIRACIPPPRHVFDDKPKCQDGRDSEGPAYRQGRKGREKKGHCRKTSKSQKRYPEHAPKEHRA